MLKFDLHVATESCEDKDFERALTNLGLKDDCLVGRYFNFYGNIAVSSCPFIGLHMSKKYDEKQPSEALRQIRKEIKLIAALFRKYNITGYAHAETTRPEYDLLLTAKKGFDPCVSWPVAPFQPIFSAKEHKWDIHIAIPTDELPAQLANILEQNGMYSIDRLKVRDGTRRIFRVYTIQGISSSKEGRLLFNTLVNWLRAVNAPYAEIKMETYIAMIRVGKPVIVPPIIDHVQFLSDLEFKQSSIPKVA